MKKLLIVLDCEDYILEDLKKFDINEIELYPNTDAIHSYTWEDGFRLLEMPQRKCDTRAIQRKVRDLRFESGFYVETLGMKIDEYAKGYNACIDEILGGTDE